MSNKLIFFILSSHHVCFGLEGQPSSMVEFRVARLKTEGMLEISVSLHEILFVEVYISSVKEVNSVLRVAFYGLRVLAYSLVHNGVIFLASSS